MAEQIKIFGRDQGHKEEADMKKAIMLFKRFLISREAAILPMVAISFPAIIGMAGIGVDFSNWMKQKRDLQTAADAAAIAGAYEYLNGEGVVNGAVNQDAIEAAALKEAVANGYYSNNADSDIIVTVNQETNEVQVELVERANGFFAPMMMNGDAYTRSLAIALAGGGNGSFCMLSLDPTASGAVSTSGNVTIDAAGCGIAVNSNADNAIDLGGTSNIAIGDLAMVGGIDVGNNVDLESGEISTGTGTTPDPYEDLGIPEFTGCDEGDMNGNTVYNAGGTLSPGVYCGNHSFSGGDFTLEPGVYIFDGGDVNFTTNGTVFGEGVSIILTNSGGDDYGDYGAIDIAAGGDFFLSAPTEGNDMEGILIYQDRNAPTHASNGNDITGQASLNIEGVVYTPGNDMHFGGGAESESLAESPCSMIIAKTITLSGNPEMGNNCADDSGVRDITGPQGVRLVW